MNSRLTAIQLYVEPKNIPSINSKSWPIFNELLVGVRRKDLREINESFHGSTLEDLEGSKYGFWLIDRYKDNEGYSCLIFNYRHLQGCKKLDLEARKIRRKCRAELSLTQAKRGKDRIPSALSELNKAQMEYLLSLGDAANDSDIKNKNR